MKECKCMGCEQEMWEAYNYQEMGYDVGLDWAEDSEGNEHCFFYAMDKQGRWVAG